MENGWYVIKSWERMEEQYGADYLKLRPLLPEKMGFIPKGRVIEVIDGQWNGYFILEEMIMGPYLEYKEKCLVRNNSSDKWEKKEFIGYVPGLSYPVVCTDGKYKDVKKIKEETENKQKIYNESGECIGLIINKWFFKGEANE